MKRTFLAILGISGILFSCKKSDPDPTPAPASSYMTVSTGSKWTYDVITNPGMAGSTTVIDTVTVTATDTTVSGRTYRIFKHTVSSNGSNSDYYNITGNDYYRFQNLPVAGTKFENIYLKTGAAAGASWTQNVNTVVLGTPLVVSITNSIFSTGMSKTVNGVTYNDVIDVKTDLGSASLPAGSIVSDIHSFYAPKVGLIQADYIVKATSFGIDINTRTLVKTAVLL